MHVFDFGAVIGWPVERRVVQFIIRDGNPETRAEHLQLFFIQLFLLVGNVLAFARFAQPIALDRLRENNRGRAFVVNGGAERGMNFDGIVSAEAHARQLLVGKMLHHF